MLLVVLGALAVLFNSWLYVLFLFITVTLYWVLPHKCRVPLLLVASYVFYMCWNPPLGMIYGPIIFLDSLYFYLLSRAMVKWPAWRKKILIFGIVTELALLAYFKYANFLIGSVEAVLGAAHLPIGHLESTVVLPLAISFTSFILISYLVDVYRGEEKPHPSFFHFGAYLAFFPHLISGPIVRARELLAQLDIPVRFRQDVFLRGIQLFLIGLFLKVGVADAMAPMVGQVYDKASEATFATAWAGTYGFAIQIFCDFAGYTAMAQGSALMMGLVLPENFNAPYFASNISAFWTRWHMTLSRWLRDYLYIPMGGSRCGRWKTARNLLITMALGGLWHGAAWTFIAWGVLHGLYLIVYKLWQRFNIRFIPKVLGGFITFQAVCIAWVFFRAASFGDAFKLLQVMGHPDMVAPLPAESQTLLILVALFLAGHLLIRQLRRFTFPPVVVLWSQAAVNAVILMILFSTVTPPVKFIYFQF